MTSTMTDSPAVRAAAERLAVATSTGVSAAAVRDLIGSDDVELAYAVQRIGTRRRLAEGARLVGRKIGLTSPAVQRQLGVDQPDFGVLFADMDVAQTPASQRPRLLQPKIEAELAFVLSDDLDFDQLDAISARGAIECAVAALEIVDSRIADWDISFADTVADNASSGWFVLGADRLSVDDFEPRDIGMSMFVDGEIVSTGTGSACLGDPLNALAWLARTARDFGDPLRAGEIVLSGALGPMAPLRPGVHVRSELFTGTATLGAVDFILEDK
ncbi:fumarylacetoacetate hydrolase family protein [Nocardia sp. NBC_00565]|uniref:2-keto-4-pentenoate hydratase n=1 Tax=Nocardia sp. NBC_00565 TaxID=2975993 RepID=UPI002E80A4F5|nr:fumarylacetoacetate hydrolase family protein [Nocardia sp. NBC_00565]WUC07544.1 fumarylacetoacetate hydrolase family protein [Nocardia sp. NBC_00565]